ncbi:VC0807 family protein [Yinghuangia seranimata]|uniref:VC0807 family protein n=1 Tax=Yinghuangia seranimata TaxID=408067 RepID=UPI00248D03AA|nr:VC0807 family protein [Yinghuangia seranimata]MDI2132029.1 VC0807 family protein [Yinghuangia seranimata]
MSDSTAGRSGGGMRALALNWLPTLLFNVLMPVVTYNYLTGHGMSGVNALLIASLWPVAELAVVFVAKRRLDDFSMLTLIFLVLTIVTSAFFHSERLLLIKESVITGIFGVICLGTLFAARPLMFYFGRKFATDGTAEGIAYWNSLWQYEGFRATQRLITTVWGVAYIVEAVIRIALTYVLSHSAALTVNNVMPYAVTGGLLFWTIRLGNKRRAAAEAAGRVPGQASAEQQAQAEPSAS